MSVEALSDSELRSKLAEYGYPVGPVTQTTKKYLVKKLKNLIESRGASNRHSLAARYSSDETDDDTATKKKNRRKTMANPMPPPATLPEPRNQPKSRPDDRKRSSPKSPKRIDSKTDGLETGSDTDVPEEPERRKERPNLFEVSPVIRRKAESTADELLANYESPFLSEFTRRLSSQTTMPSSTWSQRLKSNQRSVQPEVKDKDSNGHFSVRPSYFAAGSSSRYVTSSLDRSQNRFKAKDETRSQNLVSLALVIVLALFFVVVAVIYLGLGGRGDNLPSLSDSNVPLCSGSSLDRNKPGVNCVLKENVDSVMQLVKRIAPVLQERAVAATCDEKTDKAYLLDDEVIGTFRSGKASEEQITNDLHSAQFLIVKNPVWGISLVEIAPEEDGEMRTIDSMEKLFVTRLNGKVGMVSRNPELPLQCLVRNKLFALFSSLLVVALGAAAVFGTQKAALWYLRYKKSTEREVFQLVSEIINTVEQHHQNSAVATPGGSQESFLAINHVRDNLILPKNRKKMAAVWEKAVKFLDENESRIRREIQQVAGEEFQVWRWLPNNTLNTSATQMSSKKSKVWQGQAFETMEGSVNSLACSPTPCLKIRHMFDPDIEFEEDWETKVQDALLEKCGDGVKVLHIRVDRGSREGCVYMKCVSQEDAGKAYRALHGCWFDGKLVTVKYLRLERYHERFPDAIRCTTPLKPSNNQRLSMQARF